MRVMTQRRFPLFALHRRAGRIVAALLLAALVAIGVFSTLFIAHAAGHDCSGHDCPVCALVVVCESNLRLIGSGYAPVSSAMVAAVILFAAPTALAVRHRTHVTPVSLKVRLNL